MDEHMDYTDNKHSTQADESLRNLARWLQLILAYPVEDMNITGDNEVLNQFEIPFVMQYHPTFYQKLPDFIMALLHNDPQVLTNYAPLLYHLAGCAVCREAYVELYGPMKEAVQVHEEHPTGNEEIRPLSAMPSGLLVQFSRLLISQAEVLLHQARHEHSDNDDQARSLLQMAMRISTHLTQQSMRSHALHDLVRVASLYAGESSPDTQSPPALSFMSVVAGTGGTRHGQIGRAH